MDSVKIVANLDLQEGDTFVITKSAFPNDYSVAVEYEVKVNDKGHLYFVTDRGRDYRLSNMTMTEGYKVQPTPEFTVGDTVRMSAEGRDKYPDEADDPWDTLGTITEDDRPSDWVYTVSWDNGEHNYYKPNELARVVVDSDQDEGEGGASTDLLATRGSTHGDFSDNSVFIQGLKDAFRGTPNWDLLSASQKEALDMMASKMGRALFGQPNFKDHWDDMSGYPQLVANRLT